MSTQEETPVTTERASLASIALAVAGLLWMAGLLWSARATITGRANAEMEVTSTAYALPGAISASLVAGAAVALAVVAAAGRRRTLGATTRFAVATGAGLVARTAGRAHHHHDQHRGLGVRGGRRFGGRRRDDRRRARPASGRPG